jgi:thiamine monophosphate synthase
MAIVGKICLVGSFDALSAEIVTAPDLLSNNLISVVVAHPSNQIDERLALVNLRQITDSHDVTLLVADDRDIIDQVGADGIEISWDRACYQELRSLWNDDLNIGCRVGLSRHAAMEAAEAGADYVHFTSDVVDDLQVDADMISLITWWSEIFEVPAMASCTGTKVQLIKLIDAGADFISLDLSAVNLLSDVSVQVAVSSS